MKCKCADQSFHFIFFMHIVYIQQSHCAAHDRFVFELKCIERKI